MLQEKTQAVVDGFQSWVWTDADRTKKVVALHCPNCTRSLDMAVIMKAEVRVMLAFASLAVCSDSAPVSAVRR